MLDVFARHTARMGNCALWLILVAALAGVPFVQAGPAAAQEKIDANKTDKRAAFQLDAMTVTAQKQEENIQEVPVSMTVLDSVVIEDAGIESIMDLGHFVPNFHILEAGNSGLNAPTTRGVYAPTEAGTVTTGLFVDGVPIFSTNGFDSSFLNIERVEVLRGPQGTLYGRGAEAGAINIITSKPGNEFTGKISTSGGHWLSSEADDWLARTSVFLNGPIIENKLFFGVSGNFVHKDGYIQNTTTDLAENDRSNWYGKLNLRLQATDKLEISTFASRKKYDDDAGQQGLSSLGAATYGFPAPDDRTVSSNLDDGFYHMTQDLQALKIQYDFTKNLSLTSITTHLHTGTDVLQDFDYTAMTLAHTKVDQSVTRLSEELRLGYAQDKLKWVLGAYIETDETEDKRSTDSIMPALVSKTHRTTGGETYAVFAHVTYPVTDRLNLVGGLRYEVSDREFEDKSAGAKKTKTWDSLSPKFAVEYTFSPAIMAYASATMGYRTGGFNTQIATTPEFYSYDPETLWSYEVGAKTTFLDGRLIANGAIFYMNISDMQVTETQPSGMAYLVNAAEATSKGFEMDLTYHPASGLSFMAGFGYTDITFDSFSDVAGNYKGNKGPWSPEYTFNLSGQYRHPDGWFARIDLVGCGKTYFDKDNTYSRDPYELVNAKVGYEWDHFDIYLYGKNIFDTRYDAVNVWGGSATLYSEPGEAGLQMTYRF